MNKKIMYEKINRIVKNVLYEQINEDLNQYVPKKAFKMVEKLNAQLKELKELTNQEYPELLDTSMNMEDFTEITSNIVIQNGCMMWTEKDTMMDKTSTQKWNIVIYEDGQYWFDEYTFKDMTSYFKDGIKKAIKYYKEYNADYDDDEQKQQEFRNKL